MKIVGPRVTKKIKLNMMTAFSAPQKPIPPNKSSASSAAKPQATRQPSVEDVFNERDNPLSLPPCNPQHILELDGEEEEDDPTPPAMNVEDDEEDDVPEEEEEDDEAELGMTSLSVY